MNVLLKKWSKFGLNRMKIVGIILHAVLKKTRFEKNFCFEMCFGVVRRAWARAQDFNDKNFVQA